MLHKHLNLKKMHYDTKMLHLTNHFKLIYFKQNYKFMSKQSFKKCDVPYN